MRYNWVWTIVILVKSDCVSKSRRGRKRDRRQAHAGHHEYQEKYASATKIPAHFAPKPVVDETSEFEIRRMRFPLFEWENGAPGHSAEHGATSFPSDATCLGKKPRQQDERPSGCWQHTATTTKILLSMNRM
jgi:hypothetical protein